MIFLSLLLAFLIEQIKPVRPNHWALRTLNRWMSWVEHLFYAGRPTHAYLVWFLSVAIPSVVAFFLHSIFFWLAPNLLTLLWSVLVLYICLGFRQFSAPFSLIKKIILEGDLAMSRTILAKWIDVPEQEWTQEQILQKIVEKSVWGLQTHVLGVLCTYAVFASLGMGPTGAVLYRLTEMFARRRANSQNVQSENLDGFAEKAWSTINWLPTRLSLILFSIVGSFEDVMTAWRRPSSTQRNDKTLLCQGAAAAINVRYLIPNPSSESPTDSELSHSPPAYAHYSSGAEIEPHHLQSLTGLAWRSVIVAMLVLLLIQISQLIALAKVLLLSV
jgi:adenosylcobinamide-phosphate synthase